MFIAEFPALITTKGMEAITARKSLLLLDSPLFLHPNKSSIIPTIARIKTTLSKEKISRLILSGSFMIKVLTAT